MKSFSQFIGSDSLNETIAIAKKYLFDKYKNQIAQIRLNPEELTGEESDDVILRKKESVWLKNNQDYNAILELVGRRQGYVGPFVKFKFEHGAPIDVDEDDPRPSLRKLINLMNESPQAVSQLRMKIEDYADMESEGGTTGFIALWDELNRLKERRKYKWVIDEIKGDLRQDIRRLSSEKIDRLFAAAELIDKADVAADVAPEDPTSNRTLLLKSSRRYRTAEEYLAYVEDMAEGVSNLDIAEKVRVIRSFEPEAGLIYNKKGFLIMSIRTARAQVEICNNVSNWCINNWAWNTYAGKKPDSLQINVYDFNRSVNDLKFTVGTTIDYLSGKYVAVNSNDKGNVTSTLMSSDPAEHFTRLGYPDDAVDAIIKALPRESTIKSIVGGLGIESSSPKDILEKVVFSTVNLNPDEADEVVAPILTIIDNQISTRMSPKEVFETYMKKGFLSIFSAKLFNQLFPDLTNDVRKDVIEFAKEVFDEITEAVVMFGSKAFPVAAAALKKKDEILRILETGESIERKS